MSQDTNIRLVDFGGRVTSDNKCVADELRKLADSVENGDYGDVIFTVTILDNGRNFLRYTTGKSGITNIDIVSACTWTAHKIMSGN